MVKNKKMENGKITYMVKLTFHEDEERQVKEFNLTVPASVELMRVVDVLSEEHEKLTAELPFGKYGEDGNSPITLLQFVCDKYGWEWSEMKYHIDLQFD